MSERNVVRVVIGISAGLTAGGSALLFAVSGVLTTRDPTPGSLPIVYVGGAVGLLMSHALAVTRREAHAR